MSKTLEVTPVGLQTPEGAARVNAAMEAQKRAIDRCANMLDDCAEMLGQLLDGHAHEETLVAAKEAWKEAQRAIEARRAANDELLRAIAGAPKRGGVK